MFRKKNKILQINLMILNNLFWLTRIMMAIQTSYKNQSQSMLEENTTIRQLNKQLPKTEKRESQLLQKIKIIKL